MKRSFTISVKEPCTQSWDAMSPDNSGRFCASCQKTVVDFTKFSDEELISYFQQLKNFGCGRFTEKQLSIPIPQRPKRLTFWAVNKFAAASLIAVLGLSFKAGAQVIITPTHNIPEREVDNTVPGKLIVIRGIVKDEKEEGIPGAAIIVKGTNFGTTTDMDGNFELELPKQDQDYTLICNSLMNGRKEVAVSYPGYTDIVMEDNLKNELENIVIGGSCARRARPTLWQRLTKPFRKK